MSVEPLLQADALLTAVILTRNEEAHLRRCLESLRGLCAKVLVVDSESTDQTRAIAQEMGAEVQVRAWPGHHAEQLNFAIAAAAATTPWMIRLDADEYLSDELRVELSRVLPAMPESVGGLVLPRRVFFQGKAIRFGGFYPQWLLRVWRTGWGRCESRLMDEQMVLSDGIPRRLRGELVDDNKQDIFWWTEKHNRYARREAAALVDLRCGLSPSALSGAHLAPETRRKRFLKESVYARMPLGLRALLYFFYRFVLRFGFLDHPRVWVFHFLQAAWYRVLVDVMVREFDDAVGKAPGAEQKAFLAERWGIRWEEPRS